MSIDPKVSTFMSLNPTSVSAETGVRTAIEKLNRAKQDIAVVVDLEDKPIGIVSARQLLGSYAQSLVAEKSESSDHAARARVAEVMCRSFSSVPQTARLSALRALVSQMDDESVVVVDGAGKTCGLLTAREFVKAFALILNGETGLARDEVRAHNRALMQENEQLARLTMEDPMLRIGNRRAMMRDMHTLHARAVRYGCQYALLLVDVDHFKAYNDNNGHVKGDEVLLQVVECLQTLVRDCDRVYRFGGEEFLVVLPETGVDGAKATADRILTKMTTFAIPHVSSPAGLVTLSMGICAVEDASTVVDWHSVLDTADQALYAAKRDGRNQAHVAQCEPTPVRWCG